MEKYKVFINVSKTWEDDDISLIVLDEKGASVDEVRERVLEGMSQGEYSDKIGDNEMYIMEIVEESSVISEEGDMLWGKL